MTGLVNAHSVMSSRMSTSLAVSRPVFSAIDLAAIAEYLLVAQQDIVRTANELRVQHPASPLIDRMMAHAGAAADLRARILGI
jgi:hypothetical protein